MSINTSLMNDMVLELTGVKELHKRGIFGQGINVLIHESSVNEEHAHNSESIIRLVAPMATTTRWSHRPSSIVEDINSEYSKEYDIISRSFSGDHSLDKSKFNKLIFSASGNSEGNISRDVYDRAVICVGSVALATNGRVYRDLCGWSSEDRPLEESLEIMGFTYLDTPNGMYSGTSCACPFVAGISALILSDYKSNGVNITPQEVRNLIHMLGKPMILKPNHTIFHDQKTGQKTIIEGTGENSYETDAKKIGSGYISLVDYISPKKEVVVVTDDTIKLKIGSNTMTVYGVDKQIPTAPIIVNGSTMLPVRALAEALGLQASWDEKTKTVTLRKKV